MAKSKALTQDENAANLAAINAAKKNAPLAPAATPSPDAPPLCEGCGKPMATGGTTRFVCLTCGKTAS